MKRENKINRVREDWLMLNKEEQLRLIFRKLIKQLIKEVRKEYFVGDLINSYADILINEVKIKFK